MKNIVRWAAGAMLLLGQVVTSAQAMPVAAPAVLADPGAITLVSGGCGPYGHRGFDGGCRPNRDGFRGRPRFDGPPRFDRPRPFYGRRCVMRMTYVGPRRICR